jgi:hypothetical protein
MSSIMNISGLYIVPSFDIGCSNDASPRSRLTPRRSRDVDDCSLPLKKRRFLHMTTSVQDRQRDINTVDASTSSSDQGGALVLTPSHEVPSHRHIVAAHQEQSSDKTEDEKVAALALISASFVVGRDTTSSSSSLPPVSPIPLGRGCLSSVRTNQHQKQDDDDDDDPLSAAMAITCLATPRSSQTKNVLCSILPGSEGTQSSENMVNTVSPLPVRPIPWQLCHRNLRSTDDCSNANNASSVATSSLSMSSTEEEDDEDGREAADNDEDHQEQESNGKSYGEVDHSTSGSVVAPNVDPSSDHYVNTNKHQTRLTNPLPNGCHGRTSRYNSFCRRQPCFNGSNYCKLHYALYQEKSKSDTTSVATTVAATVVTPAQKKKSAIQKKKSAILPASQNGTNDNTVVPTLPVVMINTPNAISKSNAQQDKRFTGSPGEIRCHATTTRGRACAYVAVGKSDDQGDDDVASKYCHLHADYDKNPPARRNKAALIASTTSLLQRGSKVFVVESYVKATKGSKNVGRNHKGDLNGSSSSSQSFPLLSMLSTDIWFNKRVIISTGPFMNRSAVVLRWGNGWVTVKLDMKDSEVTDGGKGKKKKKKDDVVHNRRSFELFLHPDQKLEPEQNK